MAAHPNQELLEPYNYLKQIPGKDVRGHLIDCFQLWLQIPDDKVASIKGIIDALHTASLLIDDIEDGSMMRRGVPVAHKICKPYPVVKCQPPSIITIIFRFRWRREYNKLCKLRLFCGLGYVYQTQ